MTLAPERSAVEAPRRAPSKWWALAAASALVVAHGWVAGWVGNQNTYLLAAVARATGGPLASDPLLNSADPTPLFSWLVAPVVGLVDGPLLVDLLWPIVAVMFFGSLCWVAGRPLRRSGTALLLWTSASALILSPITQDLFGRVTDRLDVDLPTPVALVEGFAYQYALGPYVQPSIAAVLAVLGTVLVVRRDELVWGSALVAAPVLLHPSFAAASVLLLVAVALSVLAPVLDRSATARRLAPGAVAALAVLALAAMLNREALGSFGGSAAAEANRILVEERVPNHALPERWFGLASLVVAAVVAVAAVFALRSVSGRDRRLGRFLVAALGLVGISALVAAIVDVHRLSLTFPWRASVVVVPLASAWLLGWCAVRVDRWVHDRPGPRRAVQAVAVVLLVVAGVSGARSTVDSFRSRPSGDALVELAAELELVGAGVVPTDQEDLRLNAGVPVYADLNSHPVEPDAVVDWWRRVLQVDLAMADGDALCRLVQAEDARWVVVSPTLVEDPQAHCLDAWERTAVGGLVLLRAPAW